MANPPRGATAMRRARIEEILGAALKKTETERDVYLDSACGEDAVLRGEIEQRLAEQGKTDLRTPATPTLHSPETLSKGALLGSYRIEKKLGEGGMGVVYAAEDVRLHRAVALKILPREMAADPERLQRFEREAQAVAALNHPNVVTLYGVDEADGLHFLTMELVTGKTLAELIPRHGFGLLQFLKIAAPLADAIAAAHQRGIIHRDLKPGNVMVGTDGAVKVLDFGLAKLRRGEAAGQETRTLTEAELTAQHHVIGTAAYMSPEQAEGKPVDARSDIFSLGVVFYQMATGARPFHGDSAMSLISSILKDSPPAPAEINPAIPHELDRIIRHCLAKDPERRYQSAVDIRNDLEELQQPARSSETSTTACPGSSKRLRRQIAIVAGAAVIAGAGYSIIGRGWLANGDRTAAVRAEFSQLTSQPGVEWFPSLSPDGKWLVYAGAGVKGRQIYLQSVSGQNPINLSRDAAVDDDQPAFSPDGERIAFRSSRDGGGIFVMGRTGEAARRVTRTGFKPSWSPDGTKLTFTTDNVELNPQNSEARSELWTVDVNTGIAKRISEGDAVLASWSPHNLRIAYTQRLGNPVQADIWTIPAAGGTPTAVTRDRATDWNPVWSPDGKYLYFASDRGGNMNLWRVPVDEASGRTRGEPEPVTTPAPNFAHPALSADGKRLVYTSALITANIQQLALDPLGAVRGEPAWVTTGSRRWSSPDPSPDGQWVAFYSLVQPEGHLYVAHPDGTGLRQVTNDTAIDRVPRWSPDGDWIACFSNRSGRLELWKIRPDGSELQQMTETGGGYFTWSPDGSRIATLDSTEQTDVKGAVRIFDPNRPWKQQTPDVLPALERSSARFRVSSWSPDGEWLAGQVDGTMRGIAMYSLRSRKYEVLADFGEWPVWLPDSRRVLFVAGGKAFFIVDTRSKQVRKIFSVTRDVIGPPRLTRDGKTVYFSRRVTESDVWLLTLK